MLLLVARADPPDAVAQLAQRHQALGRAVEASERAVRGVVAIAEQDVLVRLEAGSRASGERVLRVERVDVRARHRQLGHAGVELVDVDVLALEVHRGEPERVGADAEVDVLGDEDGRLALVGVADVERDHQDEVIGDLALAQGGREPTAPPRPPGSVPPRGAARRPTDARRRRAARRACAPPRGRCARAPRPPS